jgi:hypothetical protein
MKRSAWAMALSQLSAMECSQIARYLTSSWCIQMQAKRGSERLKTELKVP